MQNISKLTCPILLVYGEDDDFVETTYTYNTVQQKAQNCRTVMYTGTYHEVMCILTVFMMISYRVNITTFLSVRMYAYSHIL